MGSLSIPGALTEKVDWGEGMLSNSPISIPAAILGLPSHRGVMSLVNCRDMWGQDPLLATFAFILAFLSNIWK